MIIIYINSLLVYYHFLFFVNHFQERKVLLVTYVLFHDCIKVSYTEIKEGEKKEFQEGSHLLYVSSGQGQLTQGEKQMLLVEGMSVIVESPCLLTSSSESMDVYILDCHQQSKWLVPFRDVVFARQSPIKMVPIWKELLRIQKSSVLSEQCRFQSLIWKMLSMITDYMKMDGIEQASQYIRQHLHETICVSDLANRIGMTSSSFARVFRQKTGVSPKEFIHQERMKLAKKLMIQEKGIALKEIALRIGVQDEFYFSRLFKKREGVAPTIFMKRAQKRIAIISQLLLQDHLLSLGIQPVAAPAYPTEFSHGLPSYLCRGLEGTLLLNAEKYFNREEVLRTQPDMIIKTPLRQDAEQSALWTQQTHVHHIPFQSTWDAYLQKIAYIVEEEQKIESIIEDIQQLESRAKEILRPLSSVGKWSVIWVRANEVRLYGKTGHAFSDLFFQKLGFEPDDCLPDKSYRVIQVEDLAYMNPDRILILWSHEKDVQKLVNNKEWKKIDAIKNRNVYYPNSIEWDPWGPLGRKHMINHMVNFFKKYIK
ncbi:helix-turn-helix domain-containing protein [Anoxybacillus sp. EFIL]|nr:helix-turn-helix domain-containing protein [Anoxybacillus sp. EFIL]